MAAGRKELDNLTLAGTIQPLSPKEKPELRKKGKKHIKLPSKGVFSIKPDKYKVRIAACGNKTHETYGKISTSDLDAAMLRFLLSWSASSSNNCIASLDITAAFLNAALPEGRVVVLRPPTILYKLQLIPPGHILLANKAILADCLKLPTSDQRKSYLQGELYAVVLSQTHKSLCLLAKKRCLLKTPVTDQRGLTPKVLLLDVIALSGVHVDDFLTTGPPPLAQDFTDTLRRLWKTSGPQYLSPSVDLTFRRVTIKMTPDGLLLHQHNYTEELLREHSSHHSKKENDHWRARSLLEGRPPNPNNPEHQEWIKRGLRILGGLLWLSTRTQPDLAFAVSSTAQVLARDLELLRVKLGHLLQYLNTTKSLRLWDFFMLFLGSLT